MASEFTSGWLGNATPAWHEEGVVTNGTLPTQQAFATAQADFTVSKRPMFYQALDGNVKASNVFGLVRDDNDNLLGTCKEHYQVLQNTALMQLADFLREEIELDAVVVLSGGQRVCLTAKIRGTSSDVVPGDRVHRNLIAYNSHDGLHGLGIIFSSVRVVCANTLRLAQMRGDQKIVTHRGDVQAKWDTLVSQLDVQRRSFTNEVQQLQLMQSHKMDADLFRHYLERLYAKDLTADKPLEKLRKYKPLQHSWHHGFGSSIPGVAGTVYQGLQAVTEVETSSKRGGNSTSRFSRAHFGTGATTANRAYDLALNLCR